MYVLSHNARVFTCRPTFPLCIFMMASLFSIDSGMSFPFTSIFFILKQRWSEQIFQTPTAISTMLYYTLLSLPNFYPAHRPFQWAVIKPIRVHKDTQNNFFYGDKTDAKDSRLPAPPLQQCMINHSGNKDNRILLIIRNNSWSQRLRWVVPLPLWRNGNT